MKRQVIEALGAGVVAGDDKEAEAALRHVEVVRRGRARKLLRGTLGDAMLASGTAGAGQGEAEQRHLMRVAVLLLRGEREVNLGDAAAVETAYERELPAAPHRRFPGGLVAVLAILGGAGALTVYLARRPAAAEPVVVAAFAPAEPDVLEGPMPRRVMPPPSARAFDSGGVPLYDKKLDQALDDRLPRTVWLINQQMAGADNGARADMRALLDEKLRDPAFLELLGKGAAVRWIQLLDVMAELSRARAGSEAFVNAGMRLQDAAGLFDDELGERGLGYYLDAQVWGHGFAVFSYRVDEVMLVKGGGTTSRVLVLHRIDRLDQGRAVLGMRADWLRDPVILRDNVDQEAIMYVLPAMDQGAPMPLGNVGWGENIAIGKQLHRRAGEVAREEMAKALGPDIARTRVIGTILAERRKVVDGWRARLENDGGYLDDIHTALLPTDLFLWLRESGAVDEASLEYAGKLDSHLNELDVDGVVARIGDVVAITVARHEVQHGRDAARAVPLAQPAWVTGLIGEEGPHAVAPLVRTELSAYLSEIASDPLTPRLSLCLLAHHALDSDEWGTVATTVAALVIDRIAAKLGAPLAGKPIEGGKPDRDALAAAMLAILGHSGEEVRKSAAAVWAELYGEPLAVLE
jgi:hypothetical protein